ncbi:penicillin-binding transpeptidase domain-containing protein [Corynebacterium sp. TAE3-ERU12]|uniref:penicillin-binding transpeptidase domain-containing protein n=1 Tax=Corynebacterium sp. TAE3-ERU12 TaxID=2849491 RepID=UPI001C479846|nr:penicillin-binding transpeptidase domain-containing protein [Corynebacterium sp. TAE3-ERU12]MBV7295234.1 penicillin-binding transpeptidase domain-containing protein [Corynebacterium sp. TAE3-ERU12]
MTVNGRAGRCGERESSHLRLLTALLATVLLVAITACTPRPDTGSDVLSKFLEALSEADIPHAAELTDRPETAEKDLSEAWQGLKPKRIEAEVESLSANGAQSTGTVHLTWFLPEQRTWSYETTMHLSRTGERWKLRWAPSALHPQLGANQHLALRPVPAPRTNVVGSDGAALLEPGTVHRVVMDRDVVDSVQGTVNRIATVVNNGFPAEDESAPKVDTRAVGSAAQSGKGAYSVAVLPQGTPDNVLEQLKGVPGVSVNDEAAMIRPDPAFAPELMSRIENLVADGPRGDDGWRVVASSPEGAALAELHRVDPEVRPAVHASIAKSVQDAAQRAVDTRSDAQAMLVAIRPSTGEVLAVAQTKKADELGDVALTGQFPPGSTFKIITATAGMEIDDLNPGSTVPCPGTMEIGNRIVTNYNGMGVGMTSLSDAFARSCNTTFGNISHGLRPGQLQQQAKAFGLGVDYSVAGLTTITGSVSDTEEDAERTDAGYGQGKDLASPFGMALVAATVAHGKTPMPTLVPAKGTYADNSATPLNPQTLDELRSMMRAVVTSGTAVAIAGRGEVYGKTGEAEVDGGSHSWFAGYRGDLAFATLIIHGGGSEHAVAITDQFLAGVDEAEVLPVPN